jgi:polyisoprenoid-binding protein YceI
MKLFLAVSFTLITVVSVAQEKYYTKNAAISFYSTTPLEDIEAAHKSTVCVLDTKTGSLQFSTLIKGFEFENKEMQDHFNEHYLESDKFPKAEFKGQVANNATVNYDKPGTYPVQVTGLLTIRGITKEVQSNGVLKVEKSGLLANAAFTIKLADFGIKIPSLASDKIAKTVKISVDAKLDPLK